MRNIEAQTIPINDMPYLTVGNYWSDAAGLHFRVAEMDRPEYEQLVHIHEFTEKFLCDHDGVSNDEIDAFDIQFEKDREAGLHGQDDEPGDDPRAPYHRQHCYATAVERMLCAAMNISWDSHCYACEKAQKDWKPR